MHFLWLVFVTVFWTIIFGIVTILAFPFDSTNGRILSKIVKYWARAIFFSASVKIKIMGLDNLDTQKNYIFAANHSSSLDIPLMLGFIPFWIVPVSKIELKWIPFLGWAMQMAGHIFIDRRDHERAIATISETKESLLKTPRSILLFPEGSRTNDGNIQPFKSGGISLGILTGMPIVPVALIGTFESLNKKSNKFKKKLLTISIGSPIDTKDFEEADRKLLSELVYKRVKELKNNYS